MRKNSKYLFLLVMLCCVFFQSFAQVEAYENRMPILQAKEGWNAISLPLDIFEKTNPDLSDIRIFTIGQEIESVEQPYIIDVQFAKNKNANAEFKIINSTKTNGLYSYTFELSNTQSVNNIHLDFSNQNFDWNIQLEGSMRQNNWSTIGTNYRIVSLQNQETNFKYTNLPIPESKFNFYKISFRSSIKPDLKSAIISKEEKSNSNYLSYPIKTTTKEADTKLKTTVIYLDLGKKLPVGQIELISSYKNDYYRPIVIEGMVDSFKTEKGWNYRYSQLYRGTANSFSENTFSFKNGLFQKLRITINNFDNQPLSFENYVVKGPNYRLITRLDKTENLFLVYGNKKAIRPTYDLSFFKNKIPDDFNNASLGELKYYPKDDKEPNLLFKNKWWLWGIMIFVILLLSTFTLKMLKE